MSCLYIYIISIVIFSIPIKFNKKSIIMCIQIWYLCKFSHVLYIFSIRCFCLLVPIQITITNYMNNFKVTHGVERRGRCHHAVIPRPTCTGPGAVQGAMRQGIERCNWCTWGGWVPLQFGRAPAPASPEAILDVEYRLVDCVLPGEMDGKLSLLLRCYFPRERNRRQEKGGGGTICPTSQMPKMDLKNWNASNGSIYCF